MRRDDRPMQIWAPAELQPIAAELLQAMTSSDGKRHLVWRHSQLGHSPSSWSSCSCSCWESCQVAPELMETACVCRHCPATATRASRQPRIPASWGGFACCLLWRLPPGKPRLSLLVRKMSQKCDDMKTCTQTSAHQMFVTVCAYTLDDLLCLHRWPGGPTWG